jgi:hypothetical protein
MSVVLWWYHLRGNGVVVSPPVTVIGGGLRKKRLEAKADEWLALEAERDQALAELDELAGKPRVKRTRDKMQVARRRIAAVEHALVDMSDEVEDEDLLMVALALAAG